MQYKEVDCNIIYLYCSETWPVLDRHKQEMHVAEMNMLRWMCGVTRKDSMRNSRTRGSLLRYGHIQRNSEFAQSMAIDMAVPLSTKQMPGHATTAKS